VTCDFTIENLDYEEVAEHPEARDGIRDAVKGLIDPAIEKAVAAPAAAGAAPAAAAKPSGAPSPGFVQIHAKPKIFSKKAPQSALSHSAQHTLNSTQNFIAGAPAASPAAAPGPDNVQVFVALEEGEDDAVDANAWAVAPAGHLDAVEQQMEDVCQPHHIANALLGADGIVWKHAPKITGCKVGRHTIEKFMVDCAPHVKQIISRFSVAYTRAQVPHALEEACHLFESKLSFSGNHRITKFDKRACKQATENLMKQWQGGKGKQDYAGWCHEVCELKLGKGAPHCHI
jgi:hypothetical protein